MNTTATSSSRLPALLFLTFLVACNVTRGDVIGTITNDVLWYDTEGNEIYCQGGGILEDNGTFYWVGASKGLPEQDAYLYSSTNLQDWKAEGKVLDASDLGRNFIFRPSILKNRWGQYVIEWKGAITAYFAVSDTVTGPYTQVNTPGDSDYKFRDHSVFQDGEDAYLVVSMIKNSDAKRYVGIYKLTPDFQDIELPALYVTLREGREAPCLFKRDGYYYMTDSGTMGWDPSPTYWGYSTDLINWTRPGKVAYFNSPLPTNVLGEESAPKTDSFFSQHDFIMPIYGSEETTYVYFGDRFPGDRPDTYKGKNIILPVTWVNASGHPAKRPKIQWQEEWSINITKGTVITGPLPAASISTPSEGAAFPLGQDVTVLVEARDPSNPLQSVEFEVDGNVLSLDSSAPFEAVISGLNEGAHTLTANVVDSGASSSSTAVSIQVVSLDDTDGDGADDYSEYVAGTSPTNPNSIFYSSLDGFTASASSSGTLEWPSTSGRVYSIYGTDDLTSGFELIKDNLTYPQSIYSFTIELPQADHFYRIKVRMK